MDGDKEEIIKAIGSVKSDIAVLKEKNEQMENYIFKDLKPEIEKICGKVESCMEKADKYTQDHIRENFKWMITIIATVAIGAVGWAGLAVML